MRLIKFFGSLGLLCACAVQAQALSESPRLGIRFIQAGQNVSLRADAAGILHVPLSRESFDINYPSGTLNGCAHSESAVFDKANAGTDVGQDFNSCLFIFKSIAMPADASYIPMSADSGFSLNAAHGATKLSDKRSTFHVTHLERNGKVASAIHLTAIKGPIHLVLWIDQNKNSRIDEREIERVTLDFH